MPTKTTAKTQTKQAAGKRAAGKKAAKGAAAPGEAKAPEAKAAETMPGDAAAADAKKGLVGKGPGVIATIEALLRKATAAKPVTKEQIVEALAKKFPDRSPVAMSKTVAVQVPGRIARERGFGVERNEAGYYAV